jgi:hypothetical protein
MEALLRTKSSLFRLFYVTYMDSILSFHLFIALEFTYGGPVAN